MSHTFNTDLDTKREKTLAERKSYLLWEKKKEGERERALVRLRLLNMKHSKHIGSEVYVCLCVCVCVWA